MTVVLGEALDKDAVLLVLADLQALRGPVVDIDQEVLDLLVVDFQDADPDQQTFLLVQLLQNPRHDPHVLLAAHHAVALPAPGLSVREEATVVSLKAILDYLLPHLVVHSFLVHVSITPLFSR